MRHHLALVACLLVTGSVAHAGPGRHAGRHRAAKHERKKQVAPPLEEQDSSDDEDDEDDDEAAAPRRTKRKHAAVRALGASRRRVHAPDLDASDEATDDEPDAPPKRTKRTHALAHEDADGDDSERVAFGEPADDADDDTADEDAAVELEPVRLEKQAKPKGRPKDWHIAIGPYLWASSVDADVSLGSASVSTGVDFLDIKRHAKYGVELLAEARYKRFSIYGDLLYGVVGIDGATTVGPLMVSLEGTASSLLVDGTAGYMLVGGDRSLLSFEARAGVRYQRTTISGSVDVAGNDVSPSEYADSAVDALAGARAVVQPCRRFSLSGTVDYGVFGASTSTWSALADANVRITSHVRVSLGWRTLTTERTHVSIVMHGPRAAVQVVF